MLALTFTLSSVQAFMLVLARVAAIVFAIPFLDSRSVPLLFKAGLAMAVSVLIFYQVRPAINGFPLTVAGIFFVIAGEVVLGLAIGFMIKLIFAGIQLAGQLAGFQMGFAIANVVDPASSMQIPILAQFLNLFAIMIFMVTDMHYWFFKALVDSFSIVPPLGVGFNPAVFDTLIRFAGGLFIIALKVGSPVIVALILTHVALGLMARTVPQMQVFIVAMPLQIVVGIIFLGLSLPFWASFFHGLFMETGRAIFGLLAGFR